MRRTRKQFDIIDRIQGAERNIKTELLHGSKEEE